MDASCGGALYRRQIVPDSPEAVEIGFTSDKFRGHLERRGNSVYIWQIRAVRQSQGDFSRLLQRILDSGLSVRIPTPIGKMKEIVRRRKFRLECGFDPEGERFEVWVKDP
jgi:hypothetical protein